jgi:hypothetical protein
VNGAHRSTVASRWQSCSGSGTSQRRPARSCSTDSSASRGSTSTTTRLRGLRKLLDHRSPNPRRQLPINDWIRGRRRAAFPALLPWAHFDPTRRTPPPTLAGAGGGDARGGNRLCDAGSAAASASRRQCPPSLIVILGDTASLGGLAERTACCGDGAVHPARHRRSVCRGRHRQPVSIVDVRPRCCAWPDWFRRMQANDLGGGRRTGVCAERYSADAGMVAARARREPVVVIPRRRREELTTSRTIRRAREPPAKPRSYVPHAARRHQARQAALAAPPRRRRAGTASSAWLHQAAPPRSAGRVGLNRPDRIWAAFESRRATRAGSTARPSRRSLLARHESGHQVIAATYARALGPAPPGFRSTGCHRRGPAAHNCRDPPWPPSAGPLRSGASREGRRSPEERRRAQAGPAVAGPPHEAGRRSRAATPTLRARVLPTRKRKKRAAASRAASQSALVSDPRGQCAQRSGPCRRGGSRRGSPSWARRRSAPPGARLNLGIAIRPQQPRAPPRPIDRAHRGAPSAVNARLRGTSGVNRP